MPVKNVLEAINGDDSDIGDYDSSSGDEDDDVLANQGLQQQVRILGICPHTFRPQPYRHKLLDECFIELV